MNVLEEEIQQYINTQNELTVFDVHPDNWDATQLFRQSLTQRVRAGMTGVVTGFNYTGVEVVMKANGYDWPVFKQFQIMESIALNFWNKDK